MGQKIAAFDAQGNITAFYDSVDSPVPEGVTSTLAITDAQWQACISTPGYKVVSGALVAPPAPTAAKLLAQAQAAQIALVNKGCQTTILGGFTSSALGSARTYPSTDTDQRNLLSASIASMGQPAGWTTSLWCAAGSVWSFAAHTAEQVRQINEDWLAFRVAAQQRYADLQAKIGAASNVEEVLAVSWT